MGRGVYRPFTCHIMQYNTHIFLLLQGNLYEFLKLTGWRGSKVLYFGDHIYSDLAVRNLFPIFLLGTVLGPLIEEFISYLRLFSYFHKNENWAILLAAFFFLMSHILPNQMDQSHEIEEFWENDGN